MGRLQAHAFPRFERSGTRLPTPRKNTPPRVPKRACTLRKSIQQKTRLSAFFDCASNPHRKAPSCAFNGAERACPNHKQKTRLSAGSNRFKWWT